MAFLNKQLMYGGMFALALLVGITAGCTEAPQRRAASNNQPYVEEAKPLPPPEILNLSFLGANPPPSTDYVTQLDFELASFSGGSQPMMITDPKKPVSANYALGDYTLQVTPMLGKIKQSNNRFRWVANGYYKLDFSNAIGNPIAKLVVDANGYLYSTPKSDLPGYTVKGYTSEKRTLFVINRKTTLETYPVLGVEFKQNTVLTEFEFTDTDKFIYTFSFPDGKMMVYSAEAIGNLPEQLIAIAEVEMKQREKLKKDSKKRASSGGGG